MEVCGQLHTSDGLSQCKDISVAVGYGPELFLGPVRKQWQTERSLPLPGIDPRLYDSKPVTLLTELSGITIKIHNRICQFYGMKMAAEETDETL
jgi:hypothetical protein